MATLKTNPGESSPSIFGKLLAGLGRFFATAPGAIQKHLNVEELTRIVIASVTAGGGLFAILQAVMLHTGTIFPSPPDAALAAAVLTTIVEVHRRLGHGEAPPTGTLRSRSRA